MAIRVDVSGVPKKLQEIKTDPKLGMHVANEAARLMQPFVPEREGILKNATTDSRPWVVVYDTPYARKMYEGKADSGAPLKYTKPTAMAHWERGIDGNPALADSINAYLRRM